ncbi:MAG: hypothetical protein V3W28_02740 [Thermoplasmata archaeon]
MTSEARNPLSPPFLRRAGHWALVAGILGIIGLGALFTFFAAGPPFGLVNDILAIPGLLVLIPVGWALHRVGRGAAIAWSRSAFGALLAGVAAVAALQWALISGILSFQEQLPWVLGAGSLLGLWYALGTYLARGMLPRGLVRLGLVTGGLIVGGALLFWIGLGLQGGSMGDLADPGAFANLHPLVLLGFGLVIGSYAVSPAWALWVGQVFRRMGRESGTIAR